MNAKNPLSKQLLFGWLLLISTSLFAQTEKTSSFTFSAYMEMYYLYDLNKPINNERAPFIYSHNRHNEINLNLGLLKAAYTTQRLRANLAIAAGTYMSANYAAEPNVLKNLYEANAGVRITKEKQLWFDVGVLNSHLGFESAVSKDCWTLTRSMPADNSPYFETGAKLSYTTDNEQWFFNLLALNGWQRIKTVPGNSLISWGTQIQFKTSDKILLNYGNFVGTDKPDSARLIRVFHNLYGIFSLNKKLKLILGFDLGTEEKSKNGGGVNTWYAPIGIVQYQASEKWAIAARAEYYHDPSGVIVGTGTANGFQTFGYSMNIDYKLAKEFLLRLEARNLISRDPVFPTDGLPAKTDPFITGSFAISF